MAIILGAGPLADAFFVALKLPNFFRRITAEGAMSIAFIPVFSESLEKEGREAAHYYAGQMLRFLFWILMPLSILIIALMPYVVALIAPGFEQGELRYQTAVELSRLTFPYLLLMSLTALIGGMLNAHGRYGPFAAAPIIFNLCLIAALALHSFVVDTPAHALAVAVSLSGALQLLWVLLFARKTGFRMSIGLPKPSEKTRRTLKLMLPAMLGAGVMHINLFVDIILASTLPAGAISHLYYADRLAQLPLGVIGIAIGTALLPMLSRSIANDQSAQSATLFGQALKMGAAFAIPSALALIIMAYFIILALFTYGSFTAADAQNTALVLMAYAAGMPAYVACKTYATVFYAHQDTKTPLFMASISAVCNIILSLILIRYMGAAGIALATSISGWIQLALLAAQARGKDMCRLSRHMVLDLLKIVLSAAVMAGVLYLTLQGLEGFYAVDVTMSPYYRAGILAALVISGLILYAGMIMVLRVISPRDIKNMFSKSKMKQETE